MTYSIDAPPERAGFARRSLPAWPTSRPLRAWQQAAAAAVFAHAGGYASPQQFTDGVVPAVWIGAAIVALGGLVALLIPRTRKSDEADAVSVGVTDLQVAAA